MVEQTLDTARGPLVAVHHGRAGGARMLALHGWLDNAASFAPLAHHLSEFDLVALDLPGHGRSPHRPAGAWYHLVDYLDEVAAALDALGWQRCILLGHSLGGAIATAFAAALPEYVERLILIEALGPLPFVTGSAAAALRGAMQGRRALPGKKLRVFRNPDEAIAARMQANGLSATAARLLVERSLAPAPGGFVWRSDPRLTLTSPLRAHEEQIREWIAAIEAPTLVIAADPPSAVLDPALREARFACLRNGRQALLPGHHHLHLENPEPVAAAIGAFANANS